MNQLCRTSAFFVRPLPFLLVLAVCFAVNIIPVEAGPRIKESRLERDKEELREPLYTEWMDINNVADFVSRQGAFPLYQEINRKGESRVLLVEGMKRARYYYYCRMTEENLVERNQSYTADGLSLITLSEDADGYFSATWVDSKSVDVFKGKLEELGISVATVEE